MFRDLFQCETILKQSTALKLLPKDKLLSKLHQCSLQWSDNCIHCKTKFDTLKANIASSKKPSKEISEELRARIAQAEDKLIGFLKKF